MDCTISYADKVQQEHYTKWFKSYRWDAFLTIRLENGETGRLSHHRTEQPVMTLEDIRKVIRQNVFYKIERLVHGSVAALGCIIDNPRHAHYCIKLFKKPQSESETLAKINEMNKEFSNLRNKICKNDKSVLFTPYYKERHPKYISSPDNLLQERAIPDHYREKLFANATGSW